MLFNDCSIEMNSFNVVDQQKSRDVQRPPTYCHMTVSIDLLATDCRSQLINHLAQIFQRKQSHRVDLLYDSDESFQLFELLLVCTAGNPSIRVKSFREFNRE